MVFLDQDRMMDNVKKHNISTNLPLSQTFRSHFHKYRKPDDTEVSLKKQSNLHFSMERGMRIMN
jgi:hypothetical protein